MANYCRLIFVLTVHHPLYIYHPYQNIDNQQLGFASFCKSPTFENWLAMEQYSKILDLDLGWHKKDTSQAKLHLRLANFLIDYCCIYCLATFAGIAFGYISSVEYLFFNASQFNPFLDYVFFTSTLMVYFSSEYFFNGKSFSKFLTQTRVVHNLEPEITFKIYLLRTLWRLIPLEIFSFLPFLGDRWHDHFSETQVVNDF